MSSEVLVRRLASCVSRCCGGAALWHLRGRAGRATPETGKRWDFELVVFFATRCEVSASRPATAVRPSYHNPQAVLVETAARAAVSGGNAATGKVGGSGNVGGDAPSVAAMREAGGASAAGNGSHPPKVHAGTPKRQRWSCRARWRGSWSKRARVGMTRCARHVLSRR